VASYRLTAFGWRAEVFRRGVRKSQSAFKTKAAAVAWAGRMEADIMAGVRGEIPNLTVQALLDRYKAKKSAKKKGRRWEEIRLDALGRDELASVRLRQLDTPHVAAWQERRLDAVSGASVRRERNLLNNVLNVAVNEWKWLTKNPFVGLPRPKDGKPRKRIASPAEITQLTAPDGMLSKVILFALETGCRAGEIASLTEINGTVATVDGKTGERDVPLSKEAIKLFPDGGFGLTAGSISTLFARRCEAMGIEGLTFHDLRATAATRLSKKLDSTRLTRMFGWKDTKHVMIYYRETTEDIAKLL
jgi:integrase